MVWYRMVTVLEVYVRVVVCSQRARRSTDR